MADLSTRWLQFSKSDEDREELKTLIRNSTVVLGTLRKMMEKELQELETNKESDYSVANWSHLQADRLGQIRTLKKYIQLLT